MREFVTGVRMLLRGFGVWRAHPALMSLGLLPAVLAAFVLTALLIPFTVSLGPITGWLTPFADDWEPPWSALLRGAIGVVLFVAGAALAAAMFTALALVIGDPFYQRIWRAVEADLGWLPAGRASTLAATLGEAARLIVFGVRNAILVLLVGLIPVAGGILAVIVGVILNGRLVARELTGRSFDARGIDREARSRTLGSGRARVLGFGVATQLCFMLPFGALLAMPAAVAGATMLARGLLDHAVGPASSGDRESPDRTQGAAPDEGAGTHA